MESQERDAGSPYGRKQGKGSNAAHSPIPLVWAGCYVSCAVFTIAGLLLGGTVGVFISLSLHLIIWSLVALLRFISFIRRL